MQDSICKKLVQRVDFEVSGYDRVLQDPLRGRRLIQWFLAAVGAEGGVDVFCPEGFGVEAGAALGEEIG